MYLQKDRSRLGGAIPGYGKVLNRFVLTRGAKNMYNYRGYQKYVQLQGVPKICTTSGGSKICTTTGGAKNMYNYRGC